MKNNGFITAVMIVAALAVQPVIAADKAKS
ncbi:MAG: hypothetical protein RJA24_418, partial [Pseudomonadota bacterium]